MSPAAVVLLLTSLFSGVVAAAAPGGRPRTSSAAPTAAHRAPVPQEKVVTDDSPLPDRFKPKSRMPDADVDADRVYGARPRRSWIGVELAVGLVFFAGLLIYAFLRWQARASRGG